MFLDKWLKKQPEDQVKRLNLIDESLPHIDAETIKAFYTPVTEDDMQKKCLQLSDRLIGEVEQADMLVFACPMYNFSVPSSLKAYFDLVARVNKTFQFGPSGPQGLLHHKKAIVITTSGGFYTDNPDNHQAPFFKTMLRFIGITDVTFFHADGIDTGEENFTKGMQAAEEAIASYFMP